LKTKIVLWVEQYFYDPSLLQRGLSWLLWPLSLLYCLVVYLRYRLAQVQNFDADIIGIGNLTLGGSGKTPLTIALARHYPNSAIVLRGYGRRSQGLHVVATNGKLLCDVATSGDEAMLYALWAKESTVIVSEDRVTGIKEAIALGASTIFLDDGYSKHHIKKLDIVIQTDEKNSFCLPAGPFRERAYKDKNMVFVREGKDFRREVILRQTAPKMVLVTAIARASRLEPFLPKVEAKYYFEDHHFFTKEELVEIMQKHDADALLVTQKDYVKIKDFGLELSVLDLNLHVEKRVFNLIDTYKKREK
jgi:tetraacyldisaccharide 4'-kinase